MSELCHSLWMFPPLCKTAENMIRTRMAVVWDPAANSFNFILFHNPSANDHLLAYCYLVNQMKYIKESVRAHQGRYKYNWPGAHLQSFIHGRRRQRRCL